MRVFLASPWIPAEWVRAHCLEPRGIWLEESLGAQPLPLAAGLCPFAAQVLRLAAALPYDGFVFPTTCDQLRRGYDAFALRGPSRTFLFNVPASLSAAAKDLYRAEVERLARFLARYGASRPAPDFLRRVMLQAAEARRKKSAAAAARSPAPGFVPVALVGGPWCRYHRHLAQALAAAHLFVALDATENGERTWDLHFDLDHEPDPLAALVSGYFNHLTDIFQRPNDRFYSWLQPRLAARRARGLVLWHFTGCDLWKAEAGTLRETTGLPVLLLEADGADRVSPRTRARLQAFGETIR